LAYNRVMSTVVSQHIEMRPSAIHGEKACIAGTRIAVADIYIWHELMGMTPDQIVTDYPFLSLAQVHSALAYYYDHAEAIRTDVQKGREEAERIKASNPPILPAKVSGLGANGDPVSS
jgi:uncharacterized protein (DUF433 family)